MGRELLDNKRVHEGIEQFKPSHDKSLFPESWQERSREENQDKEYVRQQEEITNLLKVLSATLNHYFPKFNDWLNNLTDIRNPKTIIYDKKSLIWTALILMLTKQGSRKRITDSMRNGISSINLKNFSGQINLKNVPHGDTVEYFNLRVKEEEIESLQVNMMRSLLKKRALEKYRLFNKYHTIAVDGCHLYSFDYPHCKHCLLRVDENGKKHWFHYKLGASLVTETGFCLPIAGEWIENEPEYNKQDCELRAFYRLIKKLRKLYFRLPICVLLDGLYAVEPVFKLLEENNIEWIIVFKKGRMRQIYKWLTNWKKKFAKDNILAKKTYKEIPLRNSRTYEDKFLRNKPKYKTRSAIIQTTYSWMSNIAYWNDNNQRKYNLMTCQEKENNKTNCDYTWLVSRGLNLSKDTVIELAQRGRCRWKQENEGFNIQKNGGYNLEHCYSKDPASMKVWARIIDIAHIINQLIEKGSLITIKTYGSVRNIAKRMFEHFRYFIFKKPDTRPKIQIRLCAPGWNSS